MHLTYIINLVDAKAVATTISNPQSNSQKPPNFDVDEKPQSHTSTILLWVNSDFRLTRHEGTFLARVYKW